MILAGKNTEGFPIERHASLQEIKVRDQGFLRAADDIPDPRWSGVLGQRQLAEFGGQILGGTRHPVGKEAGAHPGFRCLSRVYPDIQVSIFPVPGFPVFRDLPSKVATHNRGDQFLPVAPDKFRIVPRQFEQALDQGKIRSQHSIEEQESVIIPAGNGNGFSAPGPAGSPVQIPQHAPAQQDSPTSTGAKTNPLAGVENPATQFKNGRAPRKGTHPSQVVILEDDRYDVHNILLLNPGNRAGFVARRLTPDSD